LKELSKSIKSLKGKKYISLKLDEERLLLDTLGETNAIMKQASEIAEDKDYEILNEIQKEYQKTRKFLLEIADLDE